MANSEAGSSSDAPPASGGEYQVFLNFRGPDTRHVFTDFLYHGLVNAGVRVFRDNEELRVGEVISENLPCAINNSKIYIPIFSQTYASSKWCLMELAHIVKNVSESESQKSQKSILPIFLNVEPDDLKPDDLKPDDLKLKTPLYKNALLEHEKNFPVEKVEEWRKALAKVKKIKGWNVKYDESQATIVESVVERVLEILELKQRLVPEHLVGLDDRVKYLTELLDVNHQDVRFIVIYGMGGIGKSTIAKVVFNELTSHFGKCCSFLEDIRESMLTKDGIVQLQKKLLSDIVDSRSAEGVKDSEQGMRRIGEVLGTKKVLVVLDDADDKDHIKKLIGNNSLHFGSRIIITTRNQTILQGEEFKDEIIPYEMLGMDATSALELFCQHAFGKNFPSDDYHVLSSEIVLRTGGLPLAVEVIGSLLKGKDKAFWKETKIKLRNVPKEEILKKLRISYDDLNEHQQQIFLDIACFFFNEKKTNAIDMWDHCEFYPNIGIHVLISRCLIKILDDDKFWMHDQLRDMGRRIVDQESPNDPGNRSRLLIGPKQALEIKRTKERKDKVQALQINGYGNLAITKEVFERFPNLRFLKLESVTFTGDFANCFSNVKCIFMEGPLKAISMLDMRADDMYLEHLAVFKLANNCFEDDSKVWDLIKRAQALKVLSLSGCNGITRIPDFSECLSLIELEIEECSGLTDLPEEVGALRNLQHFSLRGCSGLRELPSSLGNLTSLEELRLFRTRIRELPNSIKKLKSLRILHFAIRSSEDHAWHFPSGISMLVNLEELDLSGHKGMEGEIPIGIGALSYLRILNLACTGICKIPRTINKLHHLQTLDLSSCNKIQELPELPTSLTCLLFKSMSLRSIPNLSNLINLVELQLVGDFGTIMEGNLVTGRNLSWIGRLSRLEKLNLKLLSFSVPLELASLSHLKELVLECLDFKPFTQFPSSDWSGRNLSTLRLHSCGVRDIRLAELPRLKHFTVIHCGLLKGLSISSGLTQLRLVDVRGCDRLVEIRVESLSKSLEDLKIDVRGCDRLVEIRVESLSKSLEDLKIESCNSLKRMSGLSCLKNLKKLVIYQCEVLTDVEGLDELEYLKSLMVTDCKSLRRFIDASCTKIPDYCTLTILRCGNSIKDSRGMRLKYYREEILRNSSNKDEAKRDVSSPDEDSDSASVDESETEGCETEGYESGTEGYEGGTGWYEGEIERCVSEIAGFFYTSLEAIGSRSQMKDERIGHSRDVNGGKTTSMENRKEEKDESGEAADQNDVRSGWQRGEGVEHHESTCKATTEVEDEGDLSSRMWYERPGDCNLPTEIKSDEQVKGMAQLASKRRLIHLYVEGGVDSEWEGEYDDEMMKMLRDEWAVKTDVYSDEDGPERDVSSPDED